MTTTTTTTTPTPPPVTISLNNSTVGTGQNQFEFVGEWYSWPETEAYQGDVHGSWDGTAFYQVRFTGTRVRVYSFVGADYSTAVASIYGETGETPLTTSGANTASEQLVWTSPILPSGSHVLRVRSTGTGQLMFADRVDIETSGTVTTTYYRNLPPGAALPSEATCASQVKASPMAERRPGNHGPNHNVPATVSIPGFNEQAGYNNLARAYADRVSGDFMGTTDEIIRWAACKWGLDEDVVRAVAVNESSWYQGVTDANGVPVEGKGYGDFSLRPEDCAAGYAVNQHPKGCPTSFGLLQIKHTAHANTFPFSRDSTAFNLDYALMYRRVCYEGWMEWIRQWVDPSYGPGQEWECVGHWFSGSWTTGAQEYIDTAKRHLAARIWEQPGF